MRKTRLGWLAATALFVPLATASCSDDGGTSPLQTGSIEVLAVTSDPGDSNGYTVTVDHGAGPALAANGSVTFADRSPGDHTVLLGDIDGHCVVSGENPRTVTVAPGETTATTFTVQCSYTGDLLVTTTTSGISPADYEVTVDGDKWPIGQNETISLEELSAGPHDVLLTVPSACTVDGNAGLPNPRTANVPPDGTVEVIFGVQCPPPAARDTISHQIVFVRDYSNIYVMDEDGSNPTALTAVSDEYYSPTVSPDGTRIAFMVCYSGYGCDIFVMNADGTGRVNLTDGGFGGPQNADPSWSPDGTRILFSSDRDSYTSVNNSFNIFVMNRDGSGVTRLTDHPGSEFSPSWSPDGNRIVFATNRDGHSEIYVMNTDGSAQTNLTNHYGNDQEPSWSPDGNRIVFATERDGNPEVYVMNADGSGQTNLSNDADFDFSPSWSPDGSRIVFGRRTGDGDGEVYVMNADGSGQTNVTNFPIAWDVPGRPRAWR